jgi:hypothetical protein
MLAGHHLYRFGTIGRFSHDLHVLRGVNQYRETTAYECLVIDNCDFDHEVPLTGRLQQSAVMRGLQSRAPVVRR